MVNLSPPAISLSGVQDDTRKNVASAPHIPITPSGASGVPAGLISPAASFGDSLHRENGILSPHNSVLLEPQGSSLSEDVFSLSSDFLQEQDFHGSAFDTSNQAQLSSSLLSAHSATAAGSVGSNSGRRVRSGSLFSTNSIWNDDNLPSNSPDRSISSGAGTLDLFPDSASKPGSAAFLSPNLVPQVSPFNPLNQPRNRSHTTAGSINGPGCHKVDTFRSNLSPLLHSSQDDSTPVIDNFYLNSNEHPIQGTRNRSQTYSGVQPKISHSAMPNFIPGTSSQSFQNASQNMPNYYNGAVQHTLRNQPFTESSLSFANSHAEPFLQDDFNFFELSITTNFENPSLGPTNTLLLDNVPRFLDASKLYQLLSNPTGMVSGNHNRGVLSVRVASASNSKMALVVCPSIEVAMGLKASFNHLEIVPGAIIYVAFAKVMEKIKPANTSVHPSAISTQTPSQKSFSRANSQKSTSKETQDSEPRKTAPGASSNVDFASIADAVFASCVQLCGPIKVDFKKISGMINNAMKFPKSEYKTSFGPLPEPAGTRRFDAPKIRELRKILEANEKVSLKSHTPDSDNEDKALSQAEIESLALEMLDELPELCYDHIGNTIVQKIFSVLESPEIKLMMVKEILPYLAQLGIHKNGTWAIQKIINSSQDDAQQKVLIAESLRPYSAKLFNDQFGNYVLQCCLKFESPYNDFIFETICNNFLELSSGRFGVRCIRTILETLNDCKSPGKSPVSREQLALVAGLIVEHCNELVVNSNGSLLITWFLDTFQGLKNCMPDQRASLLCEKVMPHLGTLCTHKLANVTIFKLLNTRTEPSVRQSIMDLIFLPFNDSEYDQSRPPSSLLETILKESSENNAGPMFIQKLISYPSLFVIGDEELNQRYQQFAVSQVKRVLLEMHIANMQPYKKLLDEVGLSNSRLSRTASSNRKPKRGSNTRNGQSHPSYNQAMPGYLQIQPGQMQMQMGYGDVTGDGQPFYPPYVQAHGHPAQMNGKQAGYNPQYFNMGHSASMGPPDMHYNQDAQVLRQLEQLSLQSAAMGYTSNPGTPGGVGHQNQNSFF